MITNPEAVYLSHEKIYTDRFTSLFDKLVKDFIKEEFSYESYSNEKQLLYNRVRKWLDRSLLNKEMTNLIDAFRETSTKWKTLNYNRVFSYKEFQSLLKESGYTKESFLRAHAVYDSWHKLLELSGNRSSNIIGLLITIYNDELLNDKIDIDNYNFTVLLEDGKNSLEYKRLNDIIEPPEINTTSEKTKIEVKRLGVVLTRKDIAVFITFFRAYYKVQTKDKAELASIAYLFFGDFDLDLEQNKVTGNISFYKLLNPSKLLSDTFDYKQSQNSIIELLSYKENTKYKKLKKYIEKCDLTTFENLMEEN
ncbi:MAG: hypothetical protein KAG37_07255 [Flavobacteriales bacterium]|nr:hypothetical protein [Flavobacteriales bacterium]